MRCNIYRYTMTKDAGGGQIKTLSTQWSQWCSAEQVRSFSETDGKRVTSDQFKVVVRAYSTHPIYVSDEIHVNGWHPGKVVRIEVGKVNDVRYYTIICDLIK